MDLGDNSVWENQQFLDVLYCIILYFFILVF